MAPPGKHTAAAGVTPGRPASAHKGAGGMKCNMQHASTKERTQRKRALASYRQAAMQRCQPRAGTILWPGSSGQDGGVGGWVGWALAETGLSSTCMHRQAQADTKQTIKHRRRQPAGSCAPQTPHPQPQHKRKRTHEVAHDCVHARTQPAASAACRLPLGTPSQPMHSAAGVVVLLPPQGCCCCRPCPKHSWQPAHQERCCRKAGYHGASQHQPACLQAPRQTGWREPWPIERLCQP